MKQGDEERAPDCLGIQALCQPCRGQGRAESMATGLTTLLWLKRAQKVEDFLLLASAQPIEMLDDHICLAALALVSSDGF
jgi:hypothetical protein